MNTVSCDLSCAQKLFQQIRVIMASDQMTFVKMDRIIGRFYRSQGRDDYFDDMNKGKFLKFVEEFGFDEDELEYEVGEGAVAEDCSYLDFDDEFPHNAISKILQIEDQSECIFRFLQTLYLYPNNGACLAKKS